MAGAWPACPGAQQRRLHARMNRAPRPGHPHGQAAALAHAGRPVRPCRAGLSRAPGGCRGGRESQDTDFSAYAKPSMLADPWRGLAGAAAAAAPAPRARAPAPAPAPAPVGPAPPPGASLASVLADALEVRARLRIGVGVG